jgi:2-phosphosulfolactate phosphatase
LWSLAKNDLNGYIKKAANTSRLRKLGVGSDIEYCHKLNLTDIIPVLTEEGLVAL